MESKPYYTKKSNELKSNKYFRHLSIYYPLIYYIHQLFYLGSICETREGPFDTPIF